MIAKSITIKGWGGKSGRCVVKAVELTFYERNIVKACHELAVGSNIDCAVNSISHVVLKPIVARVRVQRRWVARRGCPRPAPLELYVQVSRHTAQASAKASFDTRFHNLFPAYF